jgi:hypothetical protein
MDHLHVDHASSPPQILVLEPYYGGSHKQMIETLKKYFNLRIISLPARKWKWRARTSSLHFMQQVEQLKDEWKSWKILITTSKFPLAEFLGILFP